MVSKGDGFCRGRMHAALPVSRNAGRMYGVVEKVREAILGCAHAFEVHSPLEGESRKPNRQVKADSVGGHSTEKAPPTGATSDYVLVLPTIPHSSIGIDPQGGSVSSLLSVDYTRRITQTGFSVTPYSTPPTPPTPLVRGAFSTTPQYAPPRPLRPGASAHRIRASEV